MVGLTGVYTGAEEGRADDPAQHWAYRKSDHGGTGHGVLA